jgi:hypothetical protein
VLEKSEAFDTSEERRVRELSVKMEVLEEDSDFEFGGNRVERGLIQAERPCTATVVCERVPFWLG